MHGDAAQVAADQLVAVKVHVAVADAAAVSRPAHLNRPSQSARIGQTKFPQSALVQKGWGCYLGRR